jgi:hypothetical protein
MRAKRRLRPSLRDGNTTPIAHLPSSELLGYFHAVPPGRIAGHRLVCNNEGRCPGLGEPWAFGPDGRSRGYHKLDAHTSPRTVLAGMTLVGATEPVPLCRRPWSGDVAGTRCPTDRTVHDRRNCRSLWIDWSCFSIQPATLDCVGNWRAMPRMRNKADARAKGLPSSR